MFKKCNITDKILSLGCSCLHNTCTVYTHNVVHVHCALYVQGLKDKRRSVDEEALEEVVRKKTRQSPSKIEAPARGRSSDIRPFQYEGKNFSDFPRGMHTKDIHLYCTCIIIHSVACTCII